jgi:hypothetical protein
MKIVLFKISILQLIILFNRMGCVESTGAQQPVGAGGDDLEGSRRARFNKATGEVAEDAHEKPEGDIFFEEEDAGQGDQFMAVKPWIGAIKEPVNHPPANPSPPSVNYELEYVYGYRCEDSRMNVYFNSAGEAVYMTAALGVILNTQSNT